MRPLILLITATALAQPSRPTFDVLSVKHVGDMQSNMIREGNMTRSTMRPFQYTPGSFSAKNTLRNILQNAYQLASYQIQGPEWMQTEVYEISAKMPDGTSKETARLMLQSGLEDRLGMKVRLEEKELSIFRMVVIPGTNKLEKVETPTGGNGVRFGMNMLESAAMPMAGLAGSLTQAAGKPVIDETGREGFYKVSLHWEAEPIPADHTGPIRIGTDPGILGAIKDLGLKLEQAKKSMPFLTVEKVSKEPTEN
jgi:uncharacterized protein (TIGR03435 family)